MQPDTIIETCEECGGAVRWLEDGKPVTSECHSGREDRLANALRGLLDRIGPGLLYVESQEAADAVTRARKELNDEQDS